jgi:hypothetical protein
MVYGTFVEAYGEFSREIAFLSRAVGNDRTRDFMNHILIEPSDGEAGRLKGVSTDGRRLHIVDPLSCPDDTGVEAGAWRPLRTGKRSSWMARITSSEAGRYPDYRRVIPRDEPVFTFELPRLPRGNGLSGYDNMPDLVRFFREFPEPVAINMNYINSLDHLLCWKVTWYGNGKPVLFESGTYTALMQAMSME